jgi:DNA polymerase-3 subunit gamma/tau
MLAFRPAGAGAPTSSASGPAVNARAPRGRDAAAAARAALAGDGASSRGVASKPAARDAASSLATAGMPGGGSAATPPASDEALSAPLAAATPAAVPAAVMPAREAPVFAAAAAPMPTPTRATGHATQAPVMPIAPAANDVGFIGFPDADSWRDWVAGCDLRGPARLLAEHVGFLGCADGVLRLSIEPDDEHLKGATMVKMLADALAPRFGQPPQLRFETPARPVDSVRVYQERARDARQAAAERDFEQHPDVRRLVAQGGRIVPESVRPLEG